jgi:hypothetical protein
MSLHMVHAVQHRLYYVTWGSRAMVVFTRVIQPVLVVKVERRWLAVLFTPRTAIQLGLIHQVIVCFLSVFLPQIQWHNILLTNILEGIEQYSYFTQASINEFSLVLFEICNDMNHRNNKILYNHKYLYKIKLNWCLIIIKMFIIWWSIGEKYETCLRSIFD